MLVPPELVRVSVRLVLLPICTLPNARLDGFAPSWPCAVPVPDRGTDNVVLLAFDWIASVPLDAPTTVGAKMALNVAVCPGLSVTGRAGPLKLKPVPLADALDRLTAVPPELVTTTAVVLFVPSVTFPKLTLVGFAVSAPAATPVPESGTLNEEFDPFEEMVTDPVTAPAVVGAKVDVKLTL